MRLSILLLLIAALQYTVADVKTKSITSSPLRLLRHQLASNRTNKNMKRFHNSIASNCCHSQLLRQLPSPSQLYQTWFAARDVPYNNDSPGMTHPCVSIARPTVSASLGVATEKGSDCWWPGTRVENTEKWRIKRYRRRVGYGYECYQRVRDAALDWEFHNNDKSIESNNSIDSRTGGEGVKSRLKMGILRLAPPAPASLLEDEPRNTNMGNPFAPLPDSLNSHVRQVFSSPGRRPLATYTQKTLNLQSFINPVRRLVPKKIQRCLCRLSPSIYAVNPVAVVYDVMDQRGQGTTYTSTAYGTLRGHWLCGEERVTVLLRDSPQHQSENTEGLNTKSIRNVSFVKKGYGRQTKLPISSDDSLLNDDGRDRPVDIEILSFSRAAPSMMGKLVWPFIGKMQETFFQSELDALEQIANKM